MSALPIRVRLTLAFAAATALVLIAAAAFVYAQLRADLDESVDGALDVRATAVAASGVDAGVVGDPEESFAQVRSGGRVVDAAGGARGAVEAISGERHVPGIEGTARVLARGGIVVGQSLDDRDEVLVRPRRRVRDRRSAGDCARLAAGIRAGRQRHAAGRGDA